METIRLTTPVETGTSSVRISFKDGIIVLGSCFADSIGSRMSALGFNVCVNPFGTLYNPMSICNSAARMAAGIPFNEGQCVRMGAGSDLVCSFSHHTSFARKTAEEFLDNANRALQEASRAWNEASKVIITLGTAWCYEHIESGEIVSNCLKIDQKLFRRRRLSVSEIASMLKSLIARNAGKEFIFTVSPIRHMKDGAHGNQLSKSTLLLAIDEVCRAFPDRTEYFPSFEIVMDELRDYRFYAEDMMHPSEQAADYIWRRFADSVLPEDEKVTLAERVRELKRSMHREMH